MDFGAIAAHQKTLGVALIHRARFDEATLIGRMTTAHAMSVFPGPP